jgi:RNA polymerase sigma-70 factor (ECF subfamily)
MNLELHTFNEKELLAAFKKGGDMELLGQLYAPYMPLVYGVCLKYLKNRETAQDAVMEVFEKLAVELKKHPVPENFKTWLYVVTKNFCLMRLRHNGSENRAFKKMSDEIMNNGFHVHPLDDIENYQWDAKLKECLEKLKTQQRSSIELFYYGKKCYKEIATQLQTDEKKVKSDIQNGKRNLKLCLEEHHEA